MRKIIPIIVAIVVITVITGTIFSMSIEPPLPNVSGEYVRTLLFLLYLPEKIDSEKCKVVAANILNLLSQPDFTRSEEFEQELNIDKTYSTIVIPCDKISSKVTSLTVYYITEDSPILPSYYGWHTNPYLLKDYRGEVYFNEQSIESFVLSEKKKVVVIDPIFTGSAYQNGFYEYWAERCDDSCLNVPICFDCLLIPDAAYGSNIQAVNVFHQLQYPIISDYDFGLNPEQIFEYDTVIMLHNEYVTKEMFDAITQHPKVMYLYPNALEKEIGFNSTNIWLIPNKNSHTNNYFDWEYENTHPYEFDRECKNWEFREISQGVQLLCYPENIIIKDLDLIKYIHDFVHSDG